MLSIRFLATAALIATTGAYIGSANVTSVPAVAVAPPADATAHGTGHEYHELVNAYGRHLCQHGCDMEHLLVHIPR